MPDLIATLRTLLADRHGISALEYGLITAVTLVVGMAAFGAIAASLSVIFGQYNAALAQ